MLSTVFRGRLLEKIKHQLRQTMQLSQYQSLLNEVWKTGFMHAIELLPKIRAPANVLYATKVLSY
jgi:hypothetical protein